MSGKIMKGLMALCLAVASAVMLIACGGGGGGSASGGGAATYPRYAYVANMYDNSISMYTVNAETGQLRPNGYVPAGNWPMAVAVDPQGRFAYALNSGGSTVSQYAIRSNGTLSVLTPAAVPVGAYSERLTVDPAGKFVYVSNLGGGSVSVYSIDAATGTLASAGTYSAGINPEDVVIDPTGRFAFAADFGDGKVLAYTVDAATGALASNGTATAGLSPEFLAVHPSGRYVYAANGGSDSISQFTIGSNGALSSLSTPTVATEGFPRGIAVDKAGKYAYAVNYASNSISQYTISASGALVSMATPTVATGTNAIAVLVDPSNKFVYVTRNGPFEVWEYPIGANGGLGAPRKVPTRFGGTSIAMTGGSSAVKYTTKFAFGVNNGDNTIQTYAVGADGYLTSKGTSTNTLGTSPGSICLDPLGRYAYAGGYTSPGSVTSFAVNSVTGALTTINSAPSGSNTSGVSVDPSGRFAYTSGLDGYVTSYNIDPFTGGLASMASTSAGLGAVPAPSGIAVEPVGRYVYVANSYANSVGAYAVNSTTGALTPIAGSPFAAGPVSYSIAIDPFGRFLFAGNMTGSSISAYAIDNNTGALAAAAGSPFTLSGASVMPRALATDPSGRFLYVGNFGGQLSALAVDQETGVLAEMAGSPYTTPATSLLAVTVDRSGSYLYAVENWSSSGKIYVYGIDAGTGALTQIGSGVNAGTTYGNPFAITTMGTYQ